MSRFQDTLKQLGFETYNAYLASDHWTNFKARYRASSFPMRCMVCRNTKIQLHHHTYQRLGAERLTDVTPLCGEHHEQVHTVLKSKSWFVDSTAKVIELIRSQMPKVVEKPIKAKPKKPKIKVKKPRLKMPRLSKIEFEKAAAFASLQKQGVTNEYVPLDYDPLCGDGQLHRFLKILRRASLRGKRLERGRKKAKAHGKFITKHLEAKEKAKRNWNEYLNLSKDNPLKRLVAGFRN